MWKFQTSDGITIPSIMGIGEITIILRNLRFLFNGGEKVVSKQFVARLKTVVIALNCVVASLALLNLFTVSAGAIQVNIPTKDDFTWDVDLEQKAVIFTGNFTVRNRGIYDIKDVDINAVLRDEVGGRLITYKNEDLVIEAGESKRFDIIALMPIDSLNMTQIIRLLLKDSVFYLDLDISATYMWGLSRFEVDETLAYPWEAPVKQLYKWFQALTLKDIIEYAKPLQEGRLPEDISALEGFDVAFDFDLDLFGDPMFTAYVNLAFEDMALGQVQFAYSLDTGWRYDITQEGVVWEP